MPDLRTEERTDAVLLGERRQRLVGEGVSIGDRIDTGGYGGSWYGQAGLYRNGGGGRYPASMAIDSNVLDWLLDSDPALRWQVQRDRRARHPKHGNRPVPGSRQRVLVLGRCRRRTQMASGLAVPTSRRVSSTVPKQIIPGSHGLRPPGRSRICVNGVSMPRKLLGPPRGWQRTAAGNTTTCPTGAARSTCASTPSYWLTVPGWAPMSRNSRYGFRPIASVTAAGTARGKKETRPARLSTQH